MTMNANTHNKKRETSKSGVHTLSELQFDGLLHETQNPPAKIDGIGPSESILHLSEKASEGLDTSALGDVDQLNQNSD